MFPLAKIREKQNYRVKGYEPIKPILLLSNCFPDSCINLHTHPSVTYESPCPVAPSMCTKILKTEYSFDVLWFLKYLPYGTFFLFFFFLRSRVDAAKSNKSVVSQVLKGWGWLFIREWYGYQHATLIILCMCFIWRHLGYRVHGPSSPWSAMMQGNHPSSYLCPPSTVSPHLASSIGSMTLSERT